MAGMADPPPRPFWPGPISVVLDPAGNLLIADTGNSRVRKVTPAGVITTVVGAGRAGYDGDGGAATAAAISAVCGLAIDPAGNIYLADTGSSVIRKVDTRGTITTVAGNGQAGFSGDGGLATKPLSTPHSPWRSGLVAISTSATKATSAYEW